MSARWRLGHALPSSCWRTTKPLRGEGPRCLGRTGYLACESDPGSDRSGRKRAPSISKLLTMTKCLNGLEADIDFLLERASGAEHWLPQANRPLPATCGRQH